MPLDEVDNNSGLVRVCHHYEIEILTLHISTASQTYASIANH